MFTVVYTFPESAQLHFRAGTWAELTHFIGYVLPDAIPLNVEKDGKVCSLLQFKNDCVLECLNRKN